MVVLDPKDRKQKLQEFLEASKGKRQELQSNLTQKAEQRAEIAQKQMVFAKQEVAKEDALKEQKVQQLQAWKQQQIEQKKAVAAMLAAKKAEADRLQFNKDAEAQKIKDQKKYMRTLRWGRVMQAAKEKRKKVAKDTKDALLQDAEQDFRRDSEVIAAGQADQVKEIKNVAIKEREGTLGTEAQILHQIAVDTRDAQTKLFKQEQNEQNLLTQQFEQKKQQIRRIPDKSLQQRTLAELERNEKQQQSIHDKKYNKLKNEIEIERQQRITTAKRTAHKTREHVSEQERQNMEAARIVAWKQKMEITSKLSADVEEAHKRELEILHSDLDEAFGINTEEEVGDD